MGAINREKWVDNAKGIGILLVVLGHSISYVGGGTFWQVACDLIYSFHMPLFFFLSAYLQRKKEINNGLYYCKETIINKVFSLLGLYLIFSVVYWLSKLIMSGVVNNQVSIKDLLLIPICPLSTMWYIYALLLFWLIRSLVSRFKAPRNLVLALSFFVCIVAYHTSFQGIWNDTIIPRLMKSVVYYSLGITFADMSANIKQSKRITPIATISWLLLFSLRYFANVKPLIGLYSILVAICGIATAISVSKQFELNCFANIGKNSLGIYLLHDYFVCFAVIALRKITNISTIQILVSFIIGTTVPYYIYKICIGNKVLSYFFQPQKILSKK